MLTRRQLLHLATATAGITLGMAAIGSPPAFAADEYDTLRLRWIDRTLLGTGYDATQEPFATLFTLMGSTASGFLSGMNPSTASLWDDLPIGSVSANVTSSYVRLKWMAQAWAFDGTGLTGDADLLAAVLTGLDWMYATAYTPTTTTYDNWWDWQIGASRLSLDIACLVHAELGSTQLANYLAAIDAFVPDSAVATYSGVSTGANRVDLCRVLIVRGILAKSSAKIATGVAGLSAVFPLVRSGDGLYADGSFVQHTNVAYTGSYGSVLISGLAGLLSLLAGSTWEVTDDNRQLLFDAVTEAFAPFLFNGLMMDGVSGRAISRGVKTVDNPLGIQQDDHVRGHLIIGSILMLADAASTDEAASWKALAKGWLERDYWAPFLEDSYQTLPVLALGKSVLDDTAVTATAEPVASRVFGSMDRATHRRTSWALAVSMCSARTAFYECINGENLRGWHTGSGMTYWWGGTYGNGQYSDAYWPTVDPYRLPGTTVSRIPLTDGQGTPRPTPPTGAVWAGGATDGTYSALGQDTRGLGSTLAAKKSWFCLDDQVVCLGAGITAGDGYAVETTVDNRNLGSAASNALTIDGTAQSTTLGWSGTFSAASWASITGVAGYVFPGGATLKALREARTGAWSDINTESSTESLTRRYLTLWVDHGTDPAGATYSYILLPGATPSLTAARAAAPTVTVLANTASVQAVTDTATGVTAANFFVAGTAGPITVSAPCSVLVRESGGTLSVSVADPTRVAATVTVTVARSGYTTGTTDDGVSVVGLAPLTLVVEVGGAQGASRTVTFGTGATVTAGTYTALAPTADAYVRDGSYADTNYGGTTDLVVKNAGTGYHRRSFLKFDLSALAGTPRRAVLWVRGATSDSTGTQATLTGYAVSSDSWTETGLTWNTQPSLGDALSSGSIGNAKDWIPIEVTGHLQTQYAGDGTATVALAESAAGVAVLLASRSSSVNQPFLQVITG
ncbi:polysaccharide lyase family 8 super-sandwich domain-containing protein [Streptomyces sp. NBC_00564]|uniref:polysaccharide lyase family 8 super-sandwich domain-containing protein n=1 Tax=Streptomyces sp. NBC_00564 TaxID=2903663 RepID=UPI00352E666A|nr:DNRLRE domain-containing protein [Streptomyces sp. NBC_00564]